MENTANNEINQQNWVKEHFQKATKYLASQGVITEKVVLEDSRYLIPLLAVWKIKTVDKNELWVISGDLPTDHMALSGAKHARDAVRSFALRWQLKAEQILGSPNKTQDQQAFANLLINRAENMYDMYENEKYWGEMSK